MPLTSLVNHIWIRKIPWQLQDLSYAEEILVAQVRHNRCGVRAASGRGKLSVNAIMFANPTLKVYNILPPSRDKLCEVLAFVFLGQTKTTEDEFERTPMLVRRERVKTALDWLKLTADCSTEGANQTFLFSDIFKEFPISQPVLHRFT
ncbi:hypothetical protein DFH09DRAFT_947747 [Mycena vulgaris]|nr:hypothetical protein DFH09DRAFT_947747 [Mycena vulgaris]